MDRLVNTSFSDKVIVITGAGGVICQSFAISLAKQGAKVAILDINEKAVALLEREIVSNGYLAKGYVCNVLDKQSLRYAQELINEDFGKCDILINGAGGNNSKATTDHEYFCSEDLNEMKTFFDLDEEGIKFVFDLNFLGTLLPTQVFALDMIGRKGCSIVNISSMNAFTPLTKIPAYSAAKASVSNLTKWLAVYFSKVGIRCNAMAPGFFSTIQNKDLLFDEEGKATDRTRKILTNTPMERFGEIEELMGTLYYLIDPQLSSFVTGVVIPVDGGFSAFSGV